MSQAPILCQTCGCIVQRGVVCCWPPRSAKDVATSVTLKLSIEISREMIEGERYFIASVISPPVLSEHPGRHVTHAMAFALRDYADRLIAGANVLDMPDLSAIQ